MSTKAELRSPPMPSKPKLTKAQRECLEACPDWSAPFEITWRRHEATGEIVSGIGNRFVLSRLRNLGLLEYSNANDTYRITPAGRATLEPSHAE